MRTQEEIVEKINGLRKNPVADIFGVMISDLLIYLDYDHAKDFLKKSVTRKTWNKDSSPKTKENVLKEMAEYMEFAVGKAEDERGLSANRSINHYQAWVWLIDLNFSEWLEKEYEDNYCDYGLPILNKIQEYIDKETNMNEVEGNEAQKE